MGWVELAGMSVYVCAGAFRAWKYTVRPPLCFCWPYVGWVVAGPLVPRMRDLQPRATASGTRSFVLCGANCAARRSLIHSAALAQ